MKKSVVTVMSHYNYENTHEGCKFPTPSPTVPDLAYSIKQLANEFAIGQLPSIASLQDFLDDADDETMDASHDIRFDDKLDALNAYLEANKVRRSVFDKVKKMHEFKKNEENALLERYRSKFGDLPPEESSGD